MQDRGMIEGLVLSCIYQDLTLVTELEPDFFSTDKSIFYFVLAREMSKTIKEVDMISVCAWCNTNGLLQVFEGYGGYESINNLLKLEDFLDIKIVIISNEMLKKVSNGNKINANYDGYVLYKNNEVDIALYSFENNVGHLVILF